MTPQRFVSELSELRFENAFNPYSDHCSVCDNDGAARQRSNILTRMLEIASSGAVDSIWVGRDLGYRGGRRTGLAFTDDVHFLDHQARWGLAVDRPTKGKLVAERTASVIWNMLDIIDRPIFLWNVFPLHPHKQGDPFTNRTHNAQERRVGTQILGRLIAMLRPSRLIAVGNDADAVLRQFSGDVDLAKVRHPSYGGQADFSAQIQDIYNVKQRTLL